MPSSVLLRRVGLIRTNISGGRIASIIRVTRIGELGISSAVTSNRRAPKMEVMRSYGTSDILRATRCKIPRGGVLYHLIIEANYILYFFLRFLPSLLFSNSFAFLHQYSSAYIFACRLTEVAMACVCGVPIRAEHPTLRAASGTCTYIAHTKEVTEISQRLARTQTE
jgi:hypothetical protein